MKKTVNIYNEDGSFEVCNLFSESDVREYSQKINDDNIRVLGYFSGKKELKKSVKEWAFSQKEKEGDDKEDIEKFIEEMLSAIEFKGKGIYAVWGYGFTNPSVARSDVFLADEIEAFNSQYDK